jgi:peptidoglycan biosynthesis protein MviN/MurJ (putative lipid II flippase)
VFHAALFTILANVVISAPLLYFVGFLGPAIGTAIAFVPTVWFYCWCIGKAAGVPAREVFPLSSYFKVLGVGMLASAPAVAYKLMFQSSAAMTLLVVTALILGTYAVLGTWLGQITREDWRFALRTVRGRFTSA